MRNNQTEYRTMTRKKSNRTTDEIKAMMAEDGEFLRPMVRTVIQEFLEAEMSETIGAQKGERTEGRLGVNLNARQRKFIIPSRSPRSIHSAAPH